jgi:hypothetical protein
MVDPQLIALAIASVSDILWDFVDLKDVLTVSICSRSFAQLPVPAQNLNRLVLRSPRYNLLGQMKLAFAHDLTAGLVRRVMNRFQTNVRATLIVDDRSGRIVLDIGSAFNDNDAFLAHEVTPVQEVETPSEQQFVKEIEISSYDEYDDFNPRHPAMKDRAHRRGDSLFNSDMDFVGNEMNQRNLSRGGGGSLGFDLSSIAAKATQEEASSREGRTHSSVKDRILAKKKHGLPPSGKTNNVPADA